MLSSSLFFSGAQSCYRQDKAGVPELGLSIIPLRSSKKCPSSSTHTHTHTQPKKEGGSDGEGGMRKKERVTRERESIGRGRGNIVRLLPHI